MVDYVFLRDDEVELEHAGGPEFYEVDGFLETADFALVGILP